MTDTNGDAATAKQKAFIDDLAKKADKDIDTADLSKSKASEVIGELLGDDGTPSTVPQKRQKEDDEVKKDANGKGSTSNGHAGESKNDSTSNGDAENPKKKQKTEKDFENTAEDKERTGGDQPATKAQKAFVESLENQVDTKMETEKLDDMTRNEASETIDKLKGEAAAKQPTALEVDKTPEEGSHLANPEKWASGDEPATDKQGRYLAVLEKKAGVEVDAGKGLSKAEASEQIQELKEKTD